MIQIRLTQKQAEAICDIEDNLELYQEIPREKRVKNHMQPLDALFG